MSPFQRAFAAATLLCACASGQFRSNVRLVVIHATVADKRGSFVTGLTAPSFHITENGRAQVVKRAVQEDSPVTLGILIDESGSMRRLYPLVMEAVRKMAEGLNPDDEVFLAHFSMHLGIDVPPATGVDALKKALAGLPPRNADARWQIGTNLFDCLQQSFDYLKQNSHRDKSALLVISDGDDSTSLLTLKQTLAAIGRQQPLIYAVGLPSKQARSGHTALQKITEASGGQAFFPGDAAEFPAIVQTIAREMRNQYTLTYTPENQDLDGSYRAIGVKVDTPPKSPPLLVRARAGYYATSSQSRE